MLIGDKYAENKLYRGIVHYDGLPLLSSEIHESIDTLYMKSSILTENLFHSGVLNSPLMKEIVREGSVKGYTPESPFAILIDGDIILVQSDDIFIDKNEALLKGYESGVVCLVGWYQLINSAENDNIKSYGGVDNLTLDFDLADNPLGEQVSSRYQFRWDKVYIDESLLSNSPVIDLTLPSRDRKGDIKEGQSPFSIQTYKMLGNVLVANKPDSVDYNYIASDIYVLPLIRYKAIMSTGSLTNIETISLSAEVEKIEVRVDNVEPKEDLTTGTIWYNPDSRVLSIYVEGTGFIPISSDIKVFRESISFNIDESKVNSSPTNIEFILESDFTEEEISSISYEGLTLVKDVHYDIDPQKNSIILKDFTTELGELLNITLLKISSSI